MLRGELCASPGLRYDPACPVHSDFEFLARVARRLPAANLPEALTRHRQHQRNSTTVRWDRFVASGARIAALAIAEELPDFRITAEEIAAVRAAVFEYVVRGGTRPLALLRRGVARYLDLWEAFAARHRGHPDLAAAEAAGLRSGPARQLAAA